MKKSFLLIIILINFLQAAVIVGDQNKISTLDGQISVTSNGATRDLNTGQVVDIAEDKEPSEVRNLQKNELNNILKDTTTKDLSKKINIRVGLFTKDEALFRYKELKKYFDPKSIVIKRNGENYLMTIEDVRYNYAQKVFPQIKKYLRK
ncbi:hypothetical protein CRU99_05590 [Malaciobacter mytili]|uniref:hypothetical protein n=1 Tax=Malaciobacter mytili TaxID=603050 RepID=UPI00100A5C81|nr:hypothetical protein [Malaciobacter mytili]RXI44260.1 hypothetical protein CRU99_05590 [Malaciobacter mytili]